MAINLLFNRWSVKEFILSKNAHRIDENCKGIQILDNISDFDVPAGVAASMCRRAEIMNFFDAVLQK